MDAQVLPGGRCGLFFGSFNPFHIGHMAIANYLLEFTDLNALRLVLSPKNPLKPARELSPSAERLAQMERAVQRSGLPISISTVEFDLPAPHYTLYTLRHLAALEPQWKFVLIMGADNLAVIQKWHKWQELLQEFEVYVYPRRGYAGQELCEAYCVRYIEAPLIEVSASFIRKGQAEGRNMNGFLAL
jgi:nicotinate (nicotinamide) nucleotide adenylyltransferase